MIKFFHIFIINFLLLSSSHAFNAPNVDSISLNKNYYESEPQLNEENILNIRYRNLDDSRSAGELKSDDYIKGNRPSSYVEVLRKPFTSFSQNFQKYSIPDNNIGIGEADLSQENQISFNKFNDKLFSKPVTKWIEKIEDVSPTKWRRDIRRKLRKKRFQARCSGPGKTKRYLDYTNSQMPFNEGQAQQQKKKEKLSEFTDEAWQDDKTCINDMEDRFDLEIKRKRLGRRMSLPLRSQERNFEMLQDDSDSENSRVRRYLDHKRVKKRISMTSTLEAKEAAMSRVLDPNLNLDGILEPHVRKRRGSRKPNGT